MMQRLQNILYTLSVVLFLMGTARGAPASHEQRLQHALALWQQGNPAQAMEALGPLEAAETLTAGLARLTFLRGTLAQHLQEPETAQRAFTLVWLAYSPLADYAAWELAQYHAAQDDIAALEALVSTLTQRYAASLLLPDSQLLLAQTQWRLGQANAARMSLGRFLHDYPTHRSQPEALFLLAQIAEANGESSRAAELWQRLGEASPQHALAGIALHRGREILEQLPAQQRPSPDAEHLLASIEPLARAQHWSEVEARLRTLAQLTQPADLAPRVLLVQATVAMRRHRWSEAQTLLQRLPHTSLQREHAAQGEYLLAQLSRRQGNDTESATHYQRVIRQYGQSPWAAEAMLALAEILEGRDQLGDAAKLLQRLAQQFPGHTKAPSSLWQAAWLHYRQRHHGTAAQLWRHFEQQFSGDALLPGVLYWQARAAQQQDKQAAATTLYQRLLTDYPFHYYAQLAQERLQEAAAPLPEAAVPPQGVWESFRLEPFPASEAGQISPQQFHLTRARELQQLQMHREAGREISALTPLLPDNYATRYFLATLYVDNQRYLDAFRHLNSILNELPAARVRQVPRSFWTLLYPVPFWSDVTTQAEANNLEPYLVLSLMRQESAFDRFAVSSAEARGLMQLLPATARRVAQQLRMPRFSTQMLFDPQANITLGTRYFATQLQRYQGNRILALAAYNAGPNRVDRWRQRWPHLPMDEFVEHIPFAETRFYVKLVLRNLMIYERLYKPLSDS
jgi:soluble lytic murein transglycosylase